MWKRDESVGPSSLRYDASHDMEGDVVNIGKSIVINGDAEIRRAGRASQAAPRVGA